VNTVTPILAKGIVTALRENCDDPIRFLADFLLKESATQQQQAETEAREKFEYLLNNC
jgi:hypothetical protein